VNSSIDGDKDYPVSKKLGKQLHELIKDTLSNDTPLATSNTKSKGRPSIVKDISD
jgi:hypothetical protein